MVRRISKMVGEKNCVCITRPYKSNATRSLLDLYRIFGKRRSVLKRDDLMVFVYVFYVGLYFFIFHMNQFMWDSFLISFDVYYMIDSLIFKYFLIDTLAILILVFFDLF